MNVLILEDRPDTAEWLMNLVHTLLPHASVTVARSLQEAFAVLPQHMWHWMLIDLGLPDGSGIEFIAHARQKRPNAQIVVTTVFDDDDNLFGALAAGANGYLLKSQPQAQLEQQLRMLLEGHPPMSPSIARKVIAHFHFPTSTPALTPQVDLTSRETEVLQAIARGMINREVAHAMGLSTQTVSTYIRNIYDKLDVHNRAQATREAVRRGIVSPDDPLE